MLRSVKPSKSIIKKARSREIELWHATRADARHLQGIPGPYLVPVVININAMQAMHGEDAFTPPALPCCFGTRLKQEDTALVQIQEIAQLLGAAIIFTMVALVSVRQWLQQVAMELGEDLTTDIMFTLEELNGPASTR